jgi:nitrate reductase delta subunit
VQAMAGYGPPTETVGLDPSDPRLLPFTPTAEGSGHGRR